MVDTGYFSPNRAVNVYSLFWAFLNFKFYFFLITTAENEVITGATWRSDYYFRTCHALSMSFTVWKDSERDSWQLWYCTPCVFTEGRGFPKHLLISFSDWQCGWHACTPSKIRKNLPFTLLNTEAAALKTWSLLKNSELEAFAVHGILISALPIKMIPKRCSPSFTTAHTEV